MNNLKMKWKSTATKRTKRPETIDCRLHMSQPHVEPVMTDARLELLANRYQANCICYLLDITFGAYLLAPRGWDRIAKHLDDGGGCRMEAGQLVINHA
jgi:hypothetical protein